MTKDPFTPIKFRNDIIEIVDNLIKTDENKFKNRPDAITYLIRYYIDHQKELKGKLE